GLVAERLARELADAELVVGRDGREDARDREAVDAAGEAAEEPPDGLDVERHDLAAVELDPAVRDQLAGGDRLAQIVRPRKERTDRVRGGAAEPDERDAPQAAPLE